jgi:soluble P-type ATPase
LIRVDIPGFGPLRLRHLVLDYNGTLAMDGKFLAGVKSRLRRLRSRLRIHVVTADTFRNAARALQRTDCRLVVLEERRQDHAKAAYVRRLGADATAAIGNGRNDRYMLNIAALGIATIQSEGAARDAIGAADIVVKDVRDALDLLLTPRRLIATLRA